MGEARPGQYPGCQAEEAVVPRMRVGATWGGVTSLPESCEVLVCEQAFQPQSSPIEGSWGVSFGNSGSRGAPRSVRGSQVFNGFRTPNPREVGSHHHIPFFGPLYGAACPIFITVNLPVGDGEAHCQTKVGFVRPGRKQLQPSRLVLLKHQT